MKSLLAVLGQGRVLISDGAWGTELHRLGLGAGECPELWNSTHRREVLGVAKGYVDAGADMILTNSFGGSPSKLGHYGCADRTAELNRAAAEISREAAGEERFVLGSMGPSGVILMMGEVDEATLFGGFALQASSLAQGGVDVICIETMSAIDEACCAVRAARSATSCEIACTFTFEKTAAGDYRTMMGVAPSDIVGPLREAGADIIGTNCGNGMDGMVDIVRELRAADAAIPLLVHANAGKPQFVNNETVFPETPEMMARKALAVVGAGANIIGGCCGTRPDHIRALVNAIKRG